MSITLEQFKAHDYLYPDITAEIICDSRFQVREGTRLTTALLQLPAIIMPELTRHRQFSFSISSNRGIPASKIMTSPKFYPAFRTKGLGMQPGAFVTDEYVKEELEDIWHNHLRVSQETVDELDDNSIAKEIKNRLLSPFQMISVLVSGTSFSNFFNLRDHKDAQFEIQVVARKLKATYEASTPRPLLSGDWHLPFIKCSERNKPMHELMAVSVARSARTSYKLPGTEIDSTFGSDLLLFNKLLSDPLHASPFEFIASPATMQHIYQQDFPKGVTSNLYGNTSGWVQLRKFFEKGIEIPETLNHLMAEVSKLKQKL